MGRQREAPLRERRAPSLERRGGGGTTRSVACRDFETFLAFDTSKDNFYVDTGVWENVIYQRLHDFLV